MRQRFVIIGQVQGVGYRFFVRHHALRLSLTGWVRNEADGTVVAEAQGSAASLSELHACLLRGPTAAVVTDVQHNDQHDLTDDLPPFQITT